MVDNDEVLDVPLVPTDMARMNVTWAEQNGDLPDPVPYDSTDEVLIRMAEEAISNGDIPGIVADPDVNLADNVVRRYPAQAGVPFHRIVVRPKTPYGR